MGSLWLSEGLAGVSITDEQDPNDSKVPEGAAQEQQRAPWESFEEQLRGFHERSARQEEIIRLMQQRVTELQGDQVQALLRPVLRRFAGLHAQAADARDGAAERGEKAVNDFSYFMIAIEEALEMIDLESVGAQAGGPFSPDTQHASSAVATGDPTLARTIQRVVSQGFKYADSDRAVVPAQVVVYRYDEKLGEVPAPTEVTSSSAEATEASAPDNEENNEGA